MQSVSVVVPVFNEEGNVTRLYREVVEAIGHLDYEIIFVNDGSTDNTQTKLENLQRLDARVIVIELRKNFGQASAIQCGFDFASKSVICTIDGDCQNDPQDIPRMLKKLDEGYDMVTGWRKKRKDNAIFRILPSRIASKLISFVTGVRLNDFGSPLKVLRKDVAKQLRLYGEMHRFIPVLASTIGCKIYEMEVNHRPRVVGKSKYGISRTFRVVLDLVLLKFLLSFGKRPLHFFGYTGLFILSLGFLGALKVFYERFFESVPAGDRPLLIISMMFILLGVQFIFSGILAELITRTYHEAQNRPTYVIRSIYSSKVDSKAESFG
ncbi:MAG: glycosyltransferase family 2 protein [Deltaproteobacteria bacterium]|nr:glycosyltransferase family 2 protein [Deltaproteobacteria bacterium]